MKGGKRVKENSLSLVPISPVDPKAEPSNREKKFQSEPQPGSWDNGVNAEAILQKGAVKRQWEDDSS